MSKSKRGFAAMNPGTQRKIASKGGKAAHERGTAFEFKEGDSKAREAGRKGGLARGRKKAAKSKVKEPEMMEEMIEAEMMM